MNLLKRAAKNQFGLARHEYFMQMSSKPFGSFGNVEDRLDNYIPVVFKRRLFLNNRVHFLVFVGSLNVEIFFIFFVIIICWFLLMEFNGGGGEMIYTLMDWASIVVALSPWAYVAWAVFADKG